MTDAVRTRSILHIGYHTINVGDGAIVHAIQRQMAQVADQPITFSNLDIADLETGYNKLRLAEVDFDAHDLILIGGGGVINGSKLYQASGMSVPISPAMLQNLKTPPGFVSIGYNVFRDRPFHHADKFIDLIRTCEALNIPFSVRNDGSLERLHAQIGAVADYIVEIPDPAFFLKVPDDYIVPQVRAGRRHVIIQLAGDSIDARLPANQPPPAQTRSRWFGLRKVNVPAPVPDPVGQFLNTFARIIEWLVRDQDVDVIMAPHILHDLKLVTGIFERLPKQIARQHTRFLGVPHSIHTPEFYAAYQQADLMIGMRLHSVIPAIGLRTPCIGIDTHDKIAGIMRNCGLEKWSLNPALPDFEDQVKALAADLLQNPAQQHPIIDAATQDFEPRFNAFLKRCWDQVATHS